MTLSKEERGLLESLGRAEFSPYDELSGATLDALISKGLAQVHEPGTHQLGYIARDPEGIRGMTSRSVSLTDLGRAALFSRYYHETP
jgi:hypothetical protein